MPVGSTCGICNTVSRNVFTYFGGRQQLQNKMKDFWGRFLGLGFPSLKCRKPVRQLQLSGTHVRDLRRDCVQEDLAVKTFFEEARVEAPSHSVEFVLQAFGAVRSPTFLMVRRELGLQLRVVTVRSRQSNG